MSKRKTLNHQQWCGLIKEQGNSGETIRAFCRQRGLIEHSFYHHKRRMRREGNGRGFKEVAIAPSSPINVVVDGCRIEVQRGFDVECLRQVVRALQ